MSAYRRLAIIGSATVAVVLGFAIAAAPSNASTSTNGVAVGVAALGQSVTVTVPRTAPSYLAISQDVPAGEALTISLYENLSTGYQWAWSASAGSDLVISYVSKSYVPDVVPSGIVGSGGTRYFVFQAGQPGTVVITFNYRRPWEGIPLQQVVLTVNVF
jgi:predicted secreted protein